MLDLNKLEQKLDKALENETTESLTDWIMKRKAKALSNFVGEKPALQLQQHAYGFPSLLSPSYPQIT